MHPKLCQEGSSSHQLAPNNYLLLGSLLVKTLSSQLRGFGFTLCFHGTSTQIMLRWTYRGAEEPLVYIHPPILIPLAELWLQRHLAWSQNWLQQLSPCP